MYPLYIRKWGGITSPSRKGMRKTRSQISENWGTRGVRRGGKKRGVRRMEKIILNIRCKG